MKSQIGHAKAAAGAASLIKTALALHHKVLPPTINVTQPNPKLDIENSPFYLNTKTRPWIREAGAGPRRAGVSAFGFGGTNFHFVMEEYDADHNGAYRLHQTPQTMLLSAPTPAQLLTRCQEQLAALESDSGAQQYAALVEASNGLNIPTASARLGFVAASQTEAQTLLQTAIGLLQKNLQAATWEHPKGIYYRQTGMETQGKVVALFPGQGSQYLDMGKSLAINFPEVREAFNRIDSLFVADQQPPLSTVIFPAPTFDPAEEKDQARNLERTQHAQPAIGAFSFGLYKILQQAGFKPDFVAGHSFGELTALWAGGVISNEDYFFLIKSRGQAMAPPADPNFDAGTMLAVKGNTAQLEAEIKHLQGVIIANYNSAEQVVLAGAKPAIQQAQQQLEAKGYFVTPLPVSAAFHTPLVEHAQQPFAEAIEQTTFSTPAIPVYSNTTGQTHPTDPRSIQLALEQHILQPVRFKQEIESIYAAGGNIFVEIGPRSVLTNLVKNILGDRPHLAIGVNSQRGKGCDHLLREAHLKLRIAGLSLNALDPYQLQPKVDQTKPKKLALNVSLNGSNYVSEKTQSAFESALQDGQKVVAPVSNNGNSSSNGKAPADGKVSTNGKVSSNGNGKALSNRKLASLPAIPAVNSNGLRPQLKPLPVVAKTMAPPVQAVANNNFGLHTVSVAPPVVANGGSPQTANQPLKSGRIQTNAALNPQSVQKSEAGSTNGNNHMSTNGQQNTTHIDPAQPSISTPTQAPRRPVNNKLQQSIALLHQHQSETLRVHETYLKNQEEYTKSIVDLMRQVYSDVPADADSINGVQPGGTTCTSPPKSNRAASCPSGCANSAGHCTGQPPPHR